MASLAINYAKAINDQGGDSDASFQIVSGLSTVFLGKLITAQNNSYKCVFFDIILNCPFCKNELQNSGTLEHFHHPNMSDWHIRNITLHIISCNAVPKMSYSVDGNIQLKRVPKFCYSFLRNEHFRRYVLKGIQDKNSVAHF